MPVVTISRQTGSGGSYVARKLAKKLGLEVVDKQLIRDVACQTQVSESEVERFDEKAPTPISLFLRDLFMGKVSLPPMMPPGMPVMAPVYPSISQTHTLDEKEYLVQIQSAIYHLAHKGDVIILGRGGQALLRGVENVFHIRITAPFEKRVERIAGLGLSGEENPADYVRRIDRDRDAYVRKHYDCDPEDPVNYHLVINTAAAGLDNSVEIAAFLVSGQGARKI